MGDGSTSKVFRNIQTDRRKNNNYKYFVWLKNIQTNSITV